MTNNLITKEQAISLAVRYKAFNDAFATLGTKETDWNGIYVWGKSLNEIQTDLGIIMTRTTVLAYAIERANEILRTEEQLAA